MSVGSTSDTRVNVHCCHATSTLMPLRSLRFRLLANIRIHTNVFDGVLTAKKYSFNELTHIQFKKSNQARNWIGEHKHNNICHIEIFLLENQWGRLYQFLTSTFLKALFFNRSKSLLHFKKNVCTFKGAFNSLCVRSQCNRFFIVSLLTVDQTAVKCLRFLKDNACCGRSLS